MTRRALTVLDLMLGRFAAFFPVATWRAWMTVAACLFGLAYGLSAEDQAFALLLLGRKVLPSEPAREFWGIFGRRGGKSRFVAWIAVYLAVFRDYRGVLARGERGVGMIVCPDRRQTRVTLRYIWAFFEGDDMLMGLVDSRTQDAIHLKNGISIEVHTASYRSVRGYTVVFAIIDEAAFLPTDDSAEPDTELLAALRPSMATVPGALLMVISSPYSRKGELWKAYKAHYGRDDDPVLVFQAPTLTMNRTVPQDVIDRAYAEDEAAASAEYGAQFRRDLEALVSREAVEAVTVPGRLELPPVSGVRYVAFVDPSGGSSDSMTLAVAHQDGEHAVLDAVREVKPPFSPEAVVEDFAALLRAYGVSTVVGDRYAGEWPRERFSKCGVTYQVSERDRSALYLAAVPLINSRRCELLDLPRLLNQLVTLERRTSRGGRDLVDHAPGNHHDDVANSAMGAIVNITSAEPGFVAWMRGRAGNAAAPVTAPPDADPDDLVLRHQECRIRGRARYADVAGRNVCQICGCDCGPAPDEPTPPVVRTSPARDIPGVDRRLL